MNIPEGSPYSLDDHKAVYRALLSSLDAEREIAMGTVGAALVHSGMKERFGYGKPKTFLEFFPEFMTFIDRVAGGVPQRWVVLHHVPEWDVELGIRPGVTGDTSETETWVSAESTGAGQMADASPAEEFMTCPAESNAATGDAMAHDGSTAVGSVGSVDSMAPVLESSSAEMAATPQSIARSMAASDKYRTAPIDDATRDELQPDFASFVFVPYASADILRANVPPTTDVHALLAESWEAAYEAGALRAFESKVTFPVAAMRADGKTPIEASIQRVWRDNPEH